MTSSLVGSEMCIRDSSLSLTLSYGSVVSSTISLTITMAVRPAWSSGGAVSYTHLTLPTICSV
eukprot:5893840-Prorocentrum_lima.AAC.1